MQTLQVGSLIEESQTMISCLDLKFDKEQNLIKELKYIIINNSNIILGLIGICDLCG